MLTHGKAEQTESEMNEDLSYPMTPPSSPTFEEISSNQPRFSLADENCQLAPSEKRRVHFHRPNPRLSAEIPWIEIVVHKETRIEEAGEDGEASSSMVVHGRRT